MLNFWKKTPFEYLYCLRWYCNLIVCVTPDVIRLGSHFHNMQIIQELCLFGPGASSFDWHKKALAISFFVINKWAVSCLSWYFSFWNIRVWRKSCALTNFFLSFIVIAVLLSGPISIKVAIFLLGLLHFREIQHRFLSSGRIFAGSWFFTLFSKKFYQHSLFDLYTTL